MFRAGDIYIITYLYTKPEQQRDFKMRSILRMYFEHSSSAVVFRVYKIILWNKGILRRALSISQQESLMTLFDASFLDRDGEICPMSPVER